MPSDRPSPLDSMHLDPTLQKKVEREYRRLLRVLEKERERFGYRRYTEIDQDLGRSPGFLAHVFNELASLTVERLLGLLALLGRPLSVLVEPLRERVPSSPRPGYVLTFTGKRSGSRAFRKLRARLDEIQVEPSGGTIAFDIQLLLRRANQDLSKGRTLVQKHLDLLMDLDPTSLTADSVESVCSLLSFSSYLYRSSGDYDRAAEWLELAFGLEARLDRPTTRALLYRDCAYLLSELGQIIEAETCASRAVQLCLASPTGKGLGESLYARAVMVKWQGEAEEALCLLEGAQIHLRDAPLTFRKAATLVAAWLHIDLNRPEAAIHALREIEETLPDLPPLFHGKVHLAHAVAASMMGRFDSAEERFALAKDSLGTYGSPADQALALLHECHHCVRSRASAQHLLDGLTSLSTQMKRGSFGEAALIDVARLILEGEVTAVALRRSIEAIEQPWSALPMKGRVSRDGPLHP